MPGEKLPIPIEEARNQNQDNNNTDNNDTDNNDTDIENLEVEETGEWFN